MTFYPFVLQGGSGGGSVNSVSGGDTSIIATSPSGPAVSLVTGTLDVLAALHPAAADWSNNNHKITSLANGSGAQDGTAFGQTAAGGNTVTIPHGGTGQVTAAAGFNALNPNAASAAFKPANPAASASITLVMMGIGAIAAYTPASSGKVLIMVTCDHQTATAGVNNSVAGRFGTGVAPVNGAAVTGTRFGGSQDAVLGANTGTNRVFACIDILSLVAGTAYWFDLAASTTNAADSVTITNISVVIIELPS